MGMHLGDIEKGLIKGPKEKLLSVEIPPTESNLRSWEHLSTEEPIPGQRRARPGTAHAALPVLGCPPVPVHFLVVLVAGLARGD